jgi:hypothetical protein
VHVAPGRCASSFAPFVGVLPVRSYGTFSLSFDDHFDHWWRSFIDVSPHASLLLLMHAGKRHVVDQAPK